MAALSILTVKFVAIALSKELAGNYNSSYGFLQLFGILADFGLYAVGVREMARAKDRSQVLGALIIIRSTILLLSLALALALIWIAPQWHGTPLPPSVTIAALVPFFTLLAGILRTVFQVHHRMQYVFIAEVLQRVITTGLIGIAIAMGVRGTTHPDVLYGFILVGGIGAAALFILSLFYARRLEPIHLCTDQEIITKILRQSIPFGIAFLCMAAYRQLDVTMIALMRPDYEIQNAEYGFVLRMVEMGYIIPTFLLNSVLPTLSERDMKGEDTRALLGKTILVLLLLGSTAALFSWFWARPLVALLTTESYLSAPGKIGSDSALRIMALPLLLNGIIQYGFYVLLNRNRAWMLVAFLACGAALSIGLNVILIPIYGYIGATLTSNVVHVILGITLGICALRVMPAIIRGKEIAKITAYALLLGFGLWRMAPLLTWEIRTIAGICVMGGYIILVAALLRMDRIFMQR